jgi:hypothetical protein
VHSNHLGQQRFFCFFFYPKKEINFGSLPIKITVEPFFYQLFILSRKENAKNIQESQSVIYFYTNCPTFYFELFPNPISLPFWSIKVNA